MTFFQVAFETVKRALTNRNTFLVFAIASIFYLVFYALPYSNQTITNIGCAIVDMDQTAQSRDLINKLKSSPGIRPVLITSNFSDAQTRFKAAEFDAMIVVPPDFERDLARGSATAVSVFANGAFPVKGRMVAGTTQLVVGSENIQVAARRLLAMGVDPTLIKRMTLLPPAFVTQDLYNSISGYGIYLVPLVAIVIVQAVMFFGIGITLGGWAADREHSDFSREIFSSSKKLAAVFAGFVTIALFWTLFLEGAGMWLLGMPSLADFPATVLSALLFTLDVVALAMCLALAMGTNRYAAGLVLASAPSLFLAGVVYPMESFAPWVLPFAWMLPTTPACRAVLFASLEGASIRDIADLLAASLAQFTVYAGLAYWIYRKRYRTR